MFLYILEVNYHTLVIIFSWDDDQVLVISEKQLQTEENDVVHSVEKEK